jgi:ubiquinone/menaquinone biosynthesis C-methylase UbiE
VIYCHQFLIHLFDPTVALREMKRVSKSPGMVACREGDMPWKWYPETEVLNLWTKLIVDMVYQDHEQVSGHHLHMMARKAGFNPDLIQKSGSITTYSSKEERA